MGCKAGEIDDIVGRHDESSAISDMVSEVITAFTTDLLLGSSSAISLRQLAAKEFSVNHHG